MDGFLPLHFAAQAGHLEARGGPVRSRLVQGARHVKILHASSWVAVKRSSFNHARVGQEMQKDQRREIKP